MKFNFVYIAFAVLILSSCGTRKYSKNNKQIEKAANKANNNTYKSYNTCLLYTSDAADE